MDSPDLIEDWRLLMERAVELYLQKEVLDIGLLGNALLLPEEHIRYTPERVVESFLEYVKGCKADPVKCLEPLFENNDRTKYDEMIHIRSVKVISLCAHHLCPIIGKAHFAYIPGNELVGLSKVSRLVEVLSRRPQIQENLTNQIVDIFQHHVEPRGCAVNIRAYHLCMMGRGVEEPTSFTETTALRGIFKDQALTREEFFHSIDKNEVVFP